MKRGAFILAEEKKAAKLPHNLILENRKNLHLSGVEDVESFDEQTVIAYTGLGQLVIRGKELHISKLNLESGELRLEGEIAALAYTDSHAGKGGFLAKMFR